MSQATEKACAAAVEKLIDWAGGSIAELARMASVSRVAAFKWRNQNGRVSESAAVLLSKLPGCPLTAQQIRPDLDAGFPAAFDSKETREAIKVQIRYMKERDAAKKVKAAACEIDRPRKSRLAKRVR